MYVGQSVADAEILAARIDSCQRFTLGPKLAEELCRILIARLMMTLGPNPVDSVPFLLHTK